MGWRGRKIKKDLAELKSCHIFVEQNKTTMTITKTDRSEMLQNVIEEFKSFGFVNSPKEPENNNFLYAASKVYKKEDTGILIHISSITDKNVYLEVYDMVNNGMSFGIIQKEVLEDFLWQLILIEFMNYFIKNKKDLVEWKSWHIFVEVLWMINK